MSEFVPARLWPVSSVLVGLLFGAIAMQVYLGDRDARLISVRIGADDVPTSADDEESDEGDGQLSLERTQPLSERHAQARELGRRGDVLKAIALYRAEIESNASPQLRAELGYWFLIAKEPKQAAQELEQAAVALPENPHVQLNWGVALRRMGDLKAARTRLEEAVRLRPAFGGARRALGVLLMRLKDFPGAIEQLKAAAGSGGNDARARASVLLARAYLKSGDEAQARKTVDRAIEWAPALAEVRIEIGRLYLSMRDREQREFAVNMLQQAAELAPDLPQPHSLLARAAMLSGDTATAERQFETTLQLDPGYSYARRHLIRLALEQQNFARARMHADLLLQVEGDVPEHHFLAGRVEAEAERPEAARQHYQDALSKADGRYPEALFNLALLEKEQKNYDESIALYQKALEQKPDYVAAANNLGLAFVAKHDSAGAETAYRQALQIDPKYAGAWFNLGGLKLDQKLYAEAIEAFQRALVLRPKYRSALVNLGVSFRKAGKLEEAIATYRRLTEIEPRYVRAWFNLGVALSAARRDEQARDAYQQALQLDPDHWPSLKNLAYVEQRLGRLSQARVNYEAFLDHSPKDADVRLALAAVLAAQGDRESCSKHATLVLSSYPGNGEARRQLERCRPQ